MTTVMRGWQNGKVPSSRPRGHADDGVPTSAVCEKLGVTYREITYWAERRTVTPMVRAEHQGYQHRWGPQDMVDVALVAMLRRNNIPLEVCARAVVAARPLLPGPSARYRFLVGIDGVFRPVTADGLLECLDTDEAVVVIDLQRLRDRAA